MGIVTLTEQNMEEEVLNSDMPVIIDFWAGWCMPCKLMAPVFEELSREYEGRLKFAKANVEEEDMLGAQFAVQSIPTLVIMNNGKEAGRIVGFGPKAVLKERIEQILKEIDA